jgi:hypothetical protein
MASFMSEIGRRYCHRGGEVKRREFSSMKRALRTAHLF